ncbi:MAG: hypothetical protein ACK4IT_05200 [Thioalkalivibrionaceae bacterium]
MEINAFQNGVAGLGKSQNRLGEAAQTIASAGVAGNQQREGQIIGSGETLRALVSLGEIENMAATNARVIKTADDMLGFLLDTRA